MPVRERRFFREKKDDDLEWIGGDVPGSGAQPQPVAVSMPERFLAFETVLKAAQGLDCFRDRDAEPSTRRHPLLRSRRCWRHQRRCAFP